LTVYCIARVLDCFPGEIRTHVNFNRSTSDDYGSDYEDGGTEFRWRDADDDDDKTTINSTRRRRDLRPRRSYHVTRRRHDVTRSQSDLAPASATRMEKT